MNSQLMACGRIVTYGMKTHAERTQARATGRSGTPRRMRAKARTASRVPGMSPNTMSDASAPTELMRRYMRTSLSHSCRVHGWPFQVNENGSVVGIWPVSTISCPVRTWVKKSGSVRPLARTMTTMTPANPAAKTVAVEGSRNTRASLVGASAHRDDLKVPMRGAVRVGRCPADGGRVSMAG